LRHALIPYLYTEAYRTHKEGLALVQPLYYEWKEKEAYEYDREYLFGQNLLVVPVTTPSGADGVSYTRAWWPEGKWTGLVRGFEYEIGKGGKEVLLCRTPSEMPVFVRAGAILPLSADKGNGCGAPKKLELRVYTGEGNYTLYEDGAFTDMVQTTGAGICSLRISARGNTENIPDGRSVYVRFENIPDGEVKVYADGKEIAVEELYKDCVATEFAFDKDKTYEVVVAYKERTADEKRIEHARKVLTTGQDDNGAKNRTYKKIVADPSLYGYWRTANEFGLETGICARLREIL
jgi:acylphosphatase